MHPQLSKTAEQVATYSKTISIGNPAPYGEMAEWSNAPVLKTGVLRGTGGSNPSLSAICSKAIGFGKFEALLNSHDQP